jgi:hypothetical protein
MSSARHFLARGTVPADQLKADIQADITSSRQAQRALQQAGQHAIADRMGADADEALDELNAVNNGTWKPKHA